MTGAALERNLMALSRVDPILAEALLKHGGHQIPPSVVESLKFVEGSPAEGISVVGPFEPAQLHELLSRGHRITIYFETLAEIIGMLGELDFRVSMFSEAFKLRVGAWKFAWEESDTDLVSTDSSSRVAFWATRAKRLRDRPKVLVLDGGLFVDDVGDALDDLGYCPLLMHVDDLPQSLWPDESYSDMVRIVSVNDRHGIEALGSCVGANVVVWQIDPDLDELRELLPSHVYLGWYRPLDDESSNLRYMPLGSNSKRRKPGVEEPFRLSFVGSSMVETGSRYLKKFSMLLENKGGDPAAVKKRIQQFTDEILSTETGRFQRHEVLEVFDELGDGIVREGDRDSGIDAVMWLGEYLASRWRLKVVSSVTAPLDVWGDDGWRAIMSDTLRFHGACGHGSQLNRVYAESLISLDIGRIYQPDIVTMRVFDVLASRRFVLTPDNLAVREIFKVDKEIVTYASLGELNEKIEYYRANPTEAHRIAERGYQRVLVDHQIRHRVDAMMRWSKTESSQ